ncbi:MAG: putative spermidine/putrescine transport system substrate-binding protein [Chloroflexota bacterium]|jgi:putative spermidine/putrescine transport system substrate-binding protein|nr:putative spermidine/putrescine transport system substrate-binding protein [Chloroflexota bacterium]
MLSTHRSATRAAGLLVVAGFVLAACSGSGATASLRTSAGVMADLVTAAKAEGNLTTIALPHGWCNYGEMLTGFTAKYGIKINELNPDGSSAQEVDAITANKTNPGPQAPDVIDVGLSFGPQAKTGGLIAPYKVATWDDIPAIAKDADGYWYGDYYGVLSFETNTKVVKNVPKDWSDLLKPEYKGQIALSGDPTQSNQAISGVWAAALANGGSLDNPQPGLDFFKKLNDMGNFVPVIAKTATVASGETPIRITWTYNGLGDKDSLKGNPPVEVAVPTSGRFGGMYVQAVSAFAPHPNAARLWMEYLYSDEGQLIWLKGYCNPIRYDVMNAAGKVPADLAAKLPDTKGAVLPTLDQITAATTAITKGWPTTVGATVK